MNLQVILAQACRLHGDRLGLTDGDFDFTYRELFALAARAATAICRLTGNDRPKVAVLLSNRWEYAVLDMACAYGGITLVRMNARDGAREAAYILQDADADCFIFSSDFALIADTARAG